MSSMYTMKKMKAAIGGLLSSNVFHLSFCVVGALFCFLPLIVRSPSFLGSTKLSQSLVSEQHFRDSSVALLALAIPLVVDIVIDLTLTMLRGKQNGLIGGLSYQSFLSNTEKILCIVGIVVVPLIVYSPQNEAHIALLYVCTSKCRAFLVGSVVMSTLCRYNKKYWSVSSTLLFMTLLGFGQIASAFTDNITENPHHHHADTLTAYAAEICTVLACAILVLCCFRWLFTEIYKDMFEDKMMNMSVHNTVVQEKQPSDLLFRVSWMCTLVIIIVFLFVINFAYGKTSNYGGTALLLNNIMYLILELAITILNMRIVKFDVIQGLHALIDSKKSYVRYISHELRTPLNTAFLGLRLLTDDMKASSDPKDADRYDTLRDVNLSCKAALDILNDLLCFDKLESGILQLHKEEISVLPFITASISLFTVQARENDISMSIVNAGHSVEEPVCRCSTLSMSLDSSELDRDMGKRTMMSPPINFHESVLIDKFKMDQVVRNLISNALKFTPKGGSISITLTHVPDNPCLQCAARSKTISTRTTSRSRAGSFAGSLAGSLFSISSSNGRDLLENEIDLEACTPSPYTEGSLIVEVTDTGAGISKENQKRLFNDIVQFNPEILQAGGGSGLGLWITKGIVDLHNGKIDVFSEGEGKGSKFTVKIPMLRRPSIAGPKHVPKKRSPSFSVERCLMNRKAKSDHFSCELLQPPMATVLAKTPEVSDYVPSRTVSDCHSYELLVVDDSRLNRKMLCKILRGAGHICDEAEDGLLAVDKVKERMAGTDITKRTYDAILMDFVMPNMDGPTATREIIALGYQAPIFGVTGNALGSDVEYFISCGARKIFTKPLDLAEFQLHMQIFLSGDD